MVYILSFSMAKKNISKNSASVDENSGYQYKMSNILNL